MLEPRRQIYSSVHFEHDDDEERNVDCIDGFERILLCLCIIIADSLGSHTSSHHLTLTIHEKNLKEV